jgi:lysophospholipase L1-like esterase
MMRHSLPRHGQPGTTGGKAWWRRSSSVRAAALLLVLLSGCLNLAPTDGAASAPDLLVAYGDSFTSALDPSRGDDPTLSWATGQLPGGSVAQRLREVWPQLQAHNGAIGGARMSDLQRQVSAGPGDADLVVLLMGLNDLCRPEGADAALFQMETRAGLAAVKQRHPDAAVVIFGIPDAAQFRTFHQLDPRVRSAWADVPFCTDVFNPSALDLLDGPRRTQAAREALNEVLRQEAERAGFVFSTALDWPYRGLEDFSADFFHPNAQGHSRMAGAAWPVLPTRP